MVEWHYVHDSLRVSLDTRFPSNWNFFYNIQVSLFDHINMSAQDLALFYALIHICHFCRQSFLGLRLSFY